MPSIIIYFITRWQEKDINDTPVLFKKVCNLWYMYGTVKYRKLSSVSALACLYYFQGFRYATRMLVFQLGHWSKVSSNDKNIL